MKLASMKDLYVAELKHLHSVEKQLVKALGKLAKAAQNAQLQEGFNQHLEETKEHQARIERILTGLGQKPPREKCEGMAGIIAEGEEMMKEDGDATVKDAALIAAGQRAEHYEMAGYGCAAAYAELLGETEAVELLRQTLEEEKATDEKLTQLAQSIINPQAAQGGEGSTGEQRSGSADSNTNSMQQGGPSVSAAFQAMGDSGGQRQSREASSRMSSTFSTGSVSMPRDDYDDRGGNSGGRGGSQSRERSSRYEEDDDRGYSSRGGGSRSSSRDDDDDRGGFSNRGGGGGNRGGNQERDENGQFSGSRGGSRSSSRDDDDNDRGGSWGRGVGGGGRGGNDDDERFGGYEGRSLGGRHSAEMQDRDDRGRFTGEEEDGRSGRGGSFSRGSGGSRSSRDDEDYRGGSGRDGNGGGGRGRGGNDDDERFGGYEGRSLGGRHSAEMQERDDQGRFIGEEEDGRSGRGGSSGRGGNGGGGRGSSGGGGNGGGSRGGRGGEHIDSAGRHYTRESWERAQEGRALGGEHSHGGGGGGRSGGGRGGR